MRLILSSFALACALVLVPACCGSQDAQQVCRTLFSQPVPMTASARREFDLVHEGRRYEYPDIQNADGTITRLLWLQDGQAGHIEELLKGHDTFKALKMRVARSGVVRDALPMPPGPANTPAQVASNEALMLVGTREQVDEATDLVNYILTSIPQIEIEARIVEIREDDDFALGTDLFLLNDRDHPFDPANPNAPLSPTSSFFDRATSSFGIPGLGGQAPVLLELGTITHGLQIDMMIQAMKNLTKTDVLSAPRIAVLNGFRAEFTAGEDVPILQQNITGTTVNITTTYRPVGIRLTVVPTLVSRDIIRMSVKTKVENVIGTTPVISGLSILPTPIIAVREATTTVDVRDGAAVVIGGLFTTQKAETHDRVPVLGEIPLVGVLFGTTRMEDTHTNLLFFIRPRLISASGDAGAVITPPADPPCK